MSEVSVQRALLAPGMMHDIDHASAPLSNIAHYARTYRKWVSDRKERFGCPVFSKQ